MMNLREYRRAAARLADFLPWAALVGPGVIVNKDGSFQRTARFRGPDLDSAVAAELVARLRLKGAALAAARTLLAAREAAKPKSVKGAAKAMERLAGSPPFWVI